MNKNLKIGIIGLFIVLGLSTTTGLAVYFKLRTEQLQDKWDETKAEMQALKKGLRIMEVSVRYRKRIGKSKITGTFSGTMRAGVKIIYTIFKYGFLK